jgi:hypothetical protein
MTTAPRSHTAGAAFRRNRRHSHQIDRQMISTTPQLTIKTTNPIAMT